ncbi:MAG: UDP-N-acetylmuramoyl-L-alanyl-D-glutamate--2,6-diaminopimelate ligase, partial [Sciscionella sp.]
MPPISPGKVALPPPRPHRVVPLALDVLAEQIGAELLGTRRATVVGATLRANQVQPGDLFAALPGSRVHGADFASAAAASGASAVLTDADGRARLEGAGLELPLLVHPSPRAVLGAASARIYGDPSARLAVLGITGTSGKTTASYMVHSALLAAGRNTGLIGTIETRVSGVRMPSSFTTPEAPDLQALFAVMLEEGVTQAVMEVSSHALALGRVGGTAFRVGAFTNLSQDHLDFHPTMEDYFAAKAQLFDGRSATEVVCIDDGWGERLVGQDTVTVSSNPQRPATWRAGKVEVHADASQTFLALGPEGVRLPITVRLPGTFNIANALLATAILHAYGIEGEAIAQGLASASVPGRMQRVDAGQDFTAVVDYSHKPAAVAEALDALRDQLVRSGEQGRIIVVLGCGGDRDTAKRPLMGEAAARRAEVLVVTDDNPRSEDPAAIRASMLAGALAVAAPQRGDVIEAADRRSAIEEAVRRARPGDVVLVAGKGHETGQD